MTPEHRPPTADMLARHWDEVYRQHGSPEAGATGVSWHRPHLERSLHWIGHFTGTQPGARILDVGTGESFLADDLLARGQTALTLLDLSATALSHLRDRLEARFPSACDHVQWLCGDVTSDLLDGWLPQPAFDVWHDRAVLHFLTAPPQRAAYVEQAARCVKPGGGLVVATFAEDGPATCSQMTVMRYSSRALAALFGDHFETVAEEHEVHVTPSGATQAFHYYVGRRK